MICLQFHGVKSMNWLPRKNEQQPRILVINTLEGDREIAFFSVNQKEKEESENGSTAA